MFARTVSISDPGTLSERFCATGTCWLRHGEGLVGIGQAARYQPTDAADAQKWWDRFCSELSVHNDLPDVFGTGPLAFVSLPFDPDNTAAQAVLQVPAFVIGKRNGRSWLTTISEATALPDLPAPPAVPTSPVPLTCSAASLEPTPWKDAVAKTISRLDDNLTKVVLARSVKATLTGEVDPVWLIRWLAERYPNCWTYHNAGLVGATPELLARLENGLVTSRVLAGTIRRNSGEEVDLKLAQSLARSSKNLIEHELAVASVATALQPFSLSMNVAEHPFILELPNVLHLASDITARVRDQASALQVAAALHPSAAVCGTPTPLALATIAELEFLDRGRYAGPVGWMNSAGDGEFGIALRCGQIDPLNTKAINIYAGCGIVAESDPEEEYAETTAKLIPMLAALGFDHD
ncbi:MAG: isochorismate synthase [Propionibacteriaceae bacterium]|nr:isochorismate synthase [Propionibacteriaceae bacterium]